MLIVGVGPRRRAPSTGHVPLGRLRLRGSSTEYLDSALGASSKNTVITIIPITTLRGSAPEFQFPTVVSI
jgi:hypothetical protein